MHAANIPSAVRAHAPSPLEEIPPDVLPLVVRHISLREGRSITSLACVSLLFAQWMAPHIKAVQLYRELLNANGSSPANVRSRCTSTLRHLAEVSEACSLELFLGVSTALQQRFPGPSIGEHIVPLLEHIRHLLQADQPAALLGLVEAHGDDVLYATQPHYLQMAACIGALQPSATQARLAETLGRHITTGNYEGHARKAQIFLAMCSRLHPVQQTGVLWEMLKLVGTGPALFRPNSAIPINRNTLEDNKKMLLWGLHDLLRAMFTHALPSEPGSRLLGRALSMPAIFADASEADKMAISLLAMAPPANGPTYWRRDPETGRSLDFCLEKMLTDVFSRGPQHDIDRFARLYQAMSHLAPPTQTCWIQAILTWCAKLGQAGVTPALMAATEQAIANFPQDEASVIADLLALCLNPQAPRDWPHPLRPREVAAAEQANYLRLFEANCANLMQVLQDAAPDVACRLLTRINNAYAEYRPLKDILPSPNQFKGELYGRFLKQALALLQTLPPANVAEHLPQWRLPRPHGVDARLADEQVLLLLAALRSISCDSKLVSPEQQETTIAALMEAAVDDIDHSPVRNRRLLDALAAFPESACAYSLRHLLGNLNQSRAHADVLFASVIEAAGRLPDAARASVLEVAARELIRFPLADALFHIDRPVPHKWRQAHFASRHPGLEASDPELHAIIRPGFITPMEGFALLLDAARTLPAVLHANVLGILCGKAHFSDFSSDDRLSDEQTLECSMRLLSSIISLPRAMTDLRARIFSDWLAHCALSFPEQHAATETRLLSTLFALPADVGKPLFEAYLSTVSDAPAKAVLKGRAATNWEIRS